MFGYRPAANAIVDRLSVPLGVQCVPKLRADVAGKVPCLLLAVMNNDAGKTESAVCDDAAHGLSVPEGDVLTPFLARQHANWQASGGAQSGNPDPYAVPVCQMNQIKSTDGAFQDCASGQNATPPGWCYVNAPTPNCPQQILFTQGQPPKGALVVLQCLEPTNGP